MTAALTAAQRETLERFISGAYKLDKLVGFLTEEQLDIALSTGEWTIRQIIHHVAEDGNAWSMPLQKALVIPGTLISFGESVENETWADALAFDRRPVRAAIALLKSHRHLIAELAVFFAEKWDNHVTFNVPDKKEPGKVSFGEIIQMLADHLDEHIATIEAIKQKHRL
jgi:hypothetical protein